MKAQQPGQHQNMQKWFLFLNSEIEITSTFRFFARLPCNKDFISKNLYLYTTSQLFLEYFLTSKNRIEYHTAKFAFNLIHKQYIWEIKTFEQEFWNKKIICGIGRFCIHLIIINNCKVCCSKFHKLSTFFVIVKYNTSKYLNKLACIFLDVEDFKCFLSVHFRITLWLLWILSRDRRFQTRSEPDSAD